MRVFGTETAQTAGNRVDTGRAPLAVRDVCTGLRAGFQLDRHTSPPALPAADARAGSRALGSAVTWGASSSTRCPTGVFYGDSEKPDQR